MYQSKRICRIHELNLSTISELPTLLGTFKTIPKMACGKAAILLIFGQSFFLLS